MVQELFVLKLKYEKLVRFDCSSKSFTCPAILKDNYINNNFSIYENKRERFLIFSCADIGFNKMKAVMIFLR